MQSQGESAVVQNLESLDALTKDSNDVGHRFCSYVLDGSPHKLF